MSTRCDLSVDVWLPEEAAEEIDATPQVCCGNAHDVVWTEHCTDLLLLQRAHRPRSRDAHQVRVGVSLVDAGDIETDSGWTSHAGATYRFWVSSGHTDQWGEVDHWTDVGSVIVTFQ
jgi:hypothetical protein